MSTVTLTEQPKTSQIYTSAALGALPFLGSKSKTVPSGRDVLLAWPLQPSVRQNGSG